MKSNTNSQLKFTAMKNLFLAAVAVMLLAPAALSAQRTSTETHFAGERITGIDASSAFDIVLVKSNQTKAVVEVSSDIESYVNISRDADGVVSIGMRDPGRRVWQAFNRLPINERAMKLTLYLPTLNSVRLSGATDLYSSDTFPGENIDIQLTGASEIDEALRISSQRVKLQCSGASEVSLALDQTKDLAMIASGASEIDIRATGLAYSKLGISGASEVSLDGDGGRGDWTVSGASELDADDFNMQELSITVSGASDAEVRSSETLTARAGGASSIHYAGNPETLNIFGDKDDIRPIR
jgi:hypothetical protein